MFRRSLVLALTVLVLSAGCRTPAPPPPPPPPPPPAPAPEATPAQVAAPTECEPENQCPDTTTGPLVRISVDRKARPDKPCVRIDRGKTEVEWVAGAGVSRIEVTFKNAPPNNPIKPDCAGITTCRLEKGSWGMAHGPFCYRIVAYKADGSFEEVDPKLIINP